MGLRALLAITLLILSAGPSVAEALTGGGSATVTSVVDGDTVMIKPKIEGANEIRLVGIQAPKLPLGRKGFEKWPLADESKARLEALTLGRVVSLKFGGRRMDRHGRLLAHLFTADNGWIQGAMLQSGLARVYSFPDNRARVLAMLDIEKAARKAKRGIWSDPYYRVRDAKTLNPLTRGFQLVEGVVFDVTAVRGMTYINFSDDWRSDFTVTLNKRALSLFAEADIELMNLKGKRIRVRGWLKKRNGPMIQASHPEQIEILDD